MTARENKKRKQQSSRQRKDIQKFFFLKRKMVNNNYRYEPTEKAYSEVKCLLHGMYLTKKLPGRDALKEALMFLRTYKPPCKWQYNVFYYSLALEVARRKVRGRRFMLEGKQQEQHYVIETIDDVECVIKDVLETLETSNEDIKEFIYHHII